jgi:hypothetical protein
VRQRFGVPIQEATNAKNIVAEIAVAERQQLFEIERTILVSCFKVHRRVKELVDDAVPRSEFAGSPRCFVNLSVIGRFSFCRSHGSDFGRAAYCRWFLLRDGACICGLTCLLLCQNFGAGWDLGSLDYRGRFLVGSVTDEILNGLPNEGRGKVRAVVAVRAHNGYCPAFCFRSLCHSWSY